MSRSCRPDQTSSRSAGVGLQDEARLRRERREADVVAEQARREAEQERQALERQRRELEERRRQLGAEPTAEDGCGGGTQCSVF